MSPRKFVTPEALPGHMEKVAQRHAEIFSPEGQAELLAKADEATKLTDAEAVSKAAAQARISRASHSRIQWMRRATDLFAVGPQSVAACRAGCSHCCNIAVVISRREAEAIAADTGARMVAKPVHMSRVQDEAFRKAGSFDAESVERYSGVPCPFLKNNRCSIYKARPIACRAYFSLDRDSLLCELVEGSGIKTPNINHHFILDNLALVVGIEPGSSDHADIRDWFPKGLSK